MHEADFILSAFTTHPLSIKLARHSHGGYSTGRVGGRYPSVIELIEHHLQVGTQMGISKYLLGHAHLCSFPL